ncbi:zinc ribbon domain-containing protein [[Ruminococcus] lactaris]
MCYLVDLCVMKIRVLECPNCHTVHNRDTNASINILKR